MPNLDMELMGCGMPADLVDSVPLDRDRRAPLDVVLVRAFSAETAHCGASSIAGRSALFLSPLSYGLDGNRLNLWSQTS